MAVLRIPTLAIHLDRQENFQFNKETQLFPIAGLVSAELARLDAKKAESSQDTTSADFKPLKVLQERHHPYIVELVASDLGVDANSIIDFELVLYDTQKACIGGVLDEFIFSARLDNLNSSYCATVGLIESLKSEAALDNDGTIRLIALFDHEEIGSLSAHGADSNLLPAVIRRLSVLPPAHFSDSMSENSYDKLSEYDHATAFEQTLASSFILSADMAHSVNPNYSGKYEADHKPEMNKGPVIKINANARYATNSPGIVLIQEIAKLAAGSNGVNGVPLQLFVVRNDSSCGSTIGTMVSAKLGVRTLDLGNPQLSMHSIRECGGTMDVLFEIRLFESFFKNYEGLESKILVDY